MDCVALERSAAFIRQMEHRVNCHPAGESTRGSQTRFRPPADAPVSRIGGAARLDLLLHDAQATSTVTDSSSSSSSSGSQCLERIDLLGLPQPRQEIAAIADQ